MKNKFHVEYLFIGQKFKIVSNISEIDRKITCIFSNEGEAGRDFFTRENEISRNSQRYNRSLQSSLKHENTCTG